MRGWPEKAAASNRAESGSGMRVARSAIMRRIASSIARIQSSGVPSGSNSESHSSSSMPSSANVASRSVSAVISGPLKAWQAPGRSEMPTLVKLPVTLIGMRRVCGPNSIAARVDVRRPSAVLASQRPLVIAGGGGWTAQSAQALQRFAENWQLPVANAFRFQDTFDNHHPLYAGDVGLGINPALARRIRRTIFRWRQTGGSPAMLPTHRTRSSMPGLSRLCRIFSTMRLTAPST